MRRELSGLAEIGFHPVVHSIWKGKDQWNGNKINRFRLSSLWTLFFWIPYWAFRKPRAFVEVLGILWSRSCPNLQNWNETFLGLGFALVRANSFRMQGFSLIHGIWATMPATAALAISKLTGIPFSMGAHAYERLQARWRLASSPQVRGSLVRADLLRFLRQKAQGNEGSSRTHQAHSAGSIPLAR